MKKKLLAILLCVCMVTAMLCVGASAASFNDTDGHWAEQAIDRWSEAGVVGGVGDGEFNPNGSMTRAEAAVMFANLLKLSGKADVSGFADVSADSWYADAIASCVDAGIMSGVGGGRMDPNGTITREMFFVMFARALGISGDTTLEKPYADGAAVASWAQSSVYALVNKGYVSGVSGNSVAPKLEINRASVMSLLSNTIVAYVVNDGTVTVDGDGVVLVLAKNVTVTGSGNVAVVVAEENAKVSLKGATGAVEVIVKENNVNVTDAPAGTVITVTAGATGVVANGESVTAGGTVTIPTTKPSTGGGSYVPPPTPPSTSRPNIKVDGKDYVWDKDKEEYYYVDNDEKEYVSNEDLKEAMDTAELVTVDGKEYIYDSEEREWVDVDEEEAVLIEDIIGGSLTTDPVD